MGIGFLVDANGNVIEVSFSVHNTPKSLAIISPSKKNGLETRIKEYVKFKVTERAKLYNFVAQTLFFKFKLIE